MKAYKVGAVTSCGHIRAVNQDRFLICLGKNQKEATALLAVADGMGGLAHGERASSIIMQMLCCWWRDSGGGRKFTQSELGQELDALIYDAHRRIYYMGQGLHEQTGTTLSLLLLRGQNYLYKQIGDSRIYLSEGAKTKQLTVDQTWCNDRLQEGILSNEEVLVHPMRHALSNALGISEELQIATGEGFARRGASFLLCSDGFYNGTPEKIDRGEWTGYALPQNALDKMMKKILGCAATDNATAILCRIPYVL